jgi:hypothetical protein
VRPTGSPPVAILLLLAACGGGERPVLAPIIDVPEGEAYPYTGLDELVLAIAPEGREGVEKTFAIGDPLELPDIDYGDDLVVHLAGRASGVEVAYGRTCALEVSEDTVDLEAHLYLSRIVKWGEGPAPAGLGAASQAYALPDGRAAFIGDNQQVVRFDPVAGGFAAIEIDGMAPRRGGVLAALPDGRAVLVGGVDPEASDSGVALVELIDPDQELAREEQPGPRLRGHAAVTLVDGSVLVVGGEMQPESGAPFATTLSAWRVAAGEGGLLEEPVQLAVEAFAARSGHSMTRLGDEVGADVLIIGGLDATGIPVAAAELYRPLREEFEALPGAALAVPRSRHRAVRMPGGSVLVVGGLTAAGAAATTLELYDPIQGRFTVAGELLSTAGVTDIAVAPMPDGRVLLIGGRDAAGDPVATVLIARLDSLDGQVSLSVTDSLAAPRAGHSAAVLCDGTILIAGGGPGSERYNPPSAGRR